jgi:predicted negative regulator of RcsB-dependent stress response
LYREKRYPEALQFLERARKSEADPEIDLHLGEVQWAMGDVDAARKTWAAGLERAPENEKLRQRLERAGR